MDSPPSTIPNGAKLNINVIRPGNNHSPDVAVVEVGPQNSFKDVIYKACFALNIGDPEIYGICTSSDLDTAARSRKSFRDATMWQPEHRALRLCNIHDGDTFTMKVRNHLSSGPQSIKVIVAPFDQEFFYRYNYNTTVQTLLDQALAAIGPAKAKISRGHTGKWKVFLPIDSPTSGIWMDPARTLHSYDLFGSTDTWSTMAQKNQDLLRPVIICKLNEERNSVKLSENFLKNPLESKWLRTSEQLESMRQKNPSKLKKMIREGIPETLRGHVWLRLAGAWDAMMMRPTLYARHKYEKIGELHWESIKKDVARTYPAHPFFAEDSQGVQVLTNVLRAIAAKHPRIGYCQGMNFLAACFLLNMDEEKAFWLLDAVVVKYCWDGFFDPDMPAIHPAMRQFKILLELNLPELSKHLDKIGMNPTIYAPPWFTTLFTYDAPLPFLFRMFDMFFAEGVSVLFRMSLAIMKDAEEELLKCDLDSAIPLVREIPQRIFHPDIIIEMATKFKYHKLMEKIFKDAEITSIMNHPKSLWETIKQKIFSPPSPVLPKASLSSSNANTQRQRPPISGSSSEKPLPTLRDLGSSMTITKQQVVVEATDPNKLDQQQPLDSSSPTTGRPRGRSRSLEGKSGSGGAISKPFIPSPVIDRRAEPLSTVGASTIPPLPTPLPSEERNAVAPISSPKSCEGVLTPVPKPIGALVDPRSSAGPSLSLSIAQKELTSQHAGDLAQPTLLIGASTVTTTSQQQTLPNVLPAAVIRPALDGENDDDDSTLMHPLLSTPTELAGAPSSSPAVAAINVSCSPSSPSEEGASDAGETASSSGRGASESTLNEEDFVLV